MPSELTVAIVAFFPHCPHDADNEVLLTNFDRTLDRNTGFATNVTLRIIADMPSIAVSFLAATVRRWLWVVLSVDQEDTVSGRKLNEK